VAGSPHRWVGREGPHGRRIGATIQGGAYGLRSTPLPRTSVNRGEGQHGFFVHVDERNILLMSGFCEALLASEQLGEQGRTARAGVSGSYLDWTSSCP